jgi:hypothetical protein
MVLKKDFRCSLGWIIYCIEQNKIQPQHMIKTIVSFFLLTQLAFAQASDGFWDNVRTTTETVKLRAGEKKIIKSADFPVGTTEVVYRITLLDDNQKVSSSLVSVLKAIPDPTGISQGTAGAIFLASTISGDDKCKYSIFTSTTDAENYMKTNKTTNACFVQNTAVNKDAKLLSAKSGCITSKTQNLWFAFESDNWVMNQKIVLEIVPWVNKKLSTGWNSETKQQLVKNVKEFSFFPKLLKKEQFTSYFIDAVSQKFTFKEFSSLLPEEKTTYIDAIIESSLKKTGEEQVFYNIIREKANKAYLAGKLDLAITTIQTDIINKNRAEATDYAAIGMYYLLSKQFEKAEKNLNLGIAKDPSEIKLQLNLAHLYMFTNRISEAKDIHNKYKNQNLSPEISWTQQAKNDFEIFKKYYFPTDNNKKILRIIE